ncbi:MAG: HNH endonuclease [Candidatus Krumholzibacteriia bacterium]
MKGFIATTDYDWFQYLSGQSDLDEVNFWAPSGKASLNTVSRYSPFFFKLKSPYNAIGGFGFLGPVTTVPMTMAWEIFGRKNGAPDLQTMARRIRKYRTRFEGTKTVVRGPYDPPVGCRLILQPVFFPPEEWIHVPRDWSGNIVQGKTYDLTMGEGKRVWQECRDRAANRNKILGSEKTTMVDGPQPRYGAETLYRPRLGQGAFRLAVTDAYGRKCAVTGEHSLPVLDSAHIKPFAEGGPHDISNGILLRADIHRLYDRGYVTVTPDYRFKVSAALQDEYENGRIYYELERGQMGGGLAIGLPVDARDYPDRDLLAWHGETVFRG